MHPNSDLSDPESEPDLALLAKVVALLEDLKRDVDGLRDQIAGRVKPYYTVDEVAELVGRSAYTVRRWVTEGRIDAIRVDGSGPRGRLLIARGEFAKLIESGVGQSVPDVVSDAD